MSVELFAYSRDPTPIKVGELVARCLIRGFECHVLRGDTVCGTDGDLASDDVFVGWRPTLFGNGARRKAVSNVDWRAIEALHAQGTVGSGAIEIWAEPDRYNEGENFEELQEIYGAEYVDLRKRSCVRWYLRLASGSNALSFAVMDVVLRSMLDLRGGVLENPQEGEAEVVRRLSDGV